MRRKMVISSLAVYAIAFSCLTLLIGRTFASTTTAIVEEGLTATVTTNAEKRGGKLPVAGNRNQIAAIEPRKSPNKVEIQSESPKVLQSSYRPVSDRANVSANSRSPNESHAYFALYDPISNQTHKFDAVEMNDSRKSVESSGKRKFRNFVSRDTLADSEMEVRVHYNGITAKETMISSGSSEEAGRRQGLKLRQLTDGKNLIQLIYNLENEIQDCDYIRRKDLAEKFLLEFRNDLEKAKIAYEVNGGELDVENQIDVEEPGRKDEWVSDGDDEFFQDETGIESYRHSDVPEEDEEELDDRSEYQIRNVTFQIFENEADFPREIASWMNYPSLRKACRRTQRNLKKLVHHSQNGDGESKKLAREKLERKKRDLMDVFRMPGTKWCGKGRRASKYTSLGMFSRTDKCCRVHDTMCPYYIGGFEEKYGLFNWKLNTIMHCRCDKRFRACLKMAKTGAANLVGKLFFNIVQTQCFVLKAEEVCTRSSFWGQCEKTEYKKKAYLRDNKPY